MGNGMWEMQGTYGMVCRIPGNVFILTFQGMLKKILGNVPEDSGNDIKDSGEYSRRFREMFQKIPGNVIKYFGECY